MQRRTNYFQVFKFAGAFVAFMIGSGFASGMEIMQFFTCFGYKGIISALISTGLFIWAGAALMVRGYDTKGETAVHPFDHWIIFERKGRSLLYISGKTISRIFEWMNPIFLFSTMVVMVSGAGAVIHQYFGLPVKMGCFLMAVIVFVSVFFGLGRLIDIIGMLGPVTIVFTISIAVFALYQNPEGLAQSEQALEAARLPKAVDAWWFAGIPYAAYNIMPAVPFLTSMGAQAGTRREAMLGAFFGSIMMMASAILLSLAQFAHAGEIAGLKIPNLFLADLLPEAFSFIFVFILLGEIFSSAAPMLWITCNQFIKDGTAGNKILAFILSAIAFVGGQIPFDRLVGTIYPFMGYIGIFLLVCILARQILGRTSG